MARKHIDLKEALSSIMHTQQVILDALIENGLPNKGDLIKRVQDTAVAVWADRIGCQRNLFEDGIERTTGARSKKRSARRRSYR